MDANHNSTRPPRWAEAFTTNLQVQISQQLLVSLGGVTTQINRLASHVATLADRIGELEKRIPTTTDKDVSNTCNNPFGGGDFGGYTQPQQAPSYLTPSHESPAPTHFDHIQSHGQLLHPPRARAATSPAFLGYTDHDMEGVLRQALEDPPPAILSSPSTSIPVDPSLENSGSEMVTSDLCVTSPVALYAQQQVHRHSHSPETTRERRSTSETTPSEAVVVRPRTQEEIDHTMQNSGISFPAPPQMVWLEDVCWFELSRMECPSRKRRNKRQTDQGECGKRWHICWEWVNYRLLSNSSLSRSVPRPCSQVTHHDGLAHVMPNCLYLPHIASREQLRRCNCGYGHDNPDARKRIQIEVLNVMAAGAGSAVRGPTDTPSGVGARRRKRASGDE